MCNLWGFALVSASVRRRRPSIRIGLPWLGGFAAWAAMARIAVDGRTFDASWAYWLSTGLVVVPAAVVLVSVLIGVRPRIVAMAGCAFASLVGTAAAVLLLHASREAGAFTFLGGWVTSMLAAGAYAFGTSRGEESWRDANSR
jgi:hypothetical protein